MIETPGLEGDSTIATSKSPPQGICSTLQPALLSPFTSLVGSNGTLTYEGNRAVGCIRNGAVLFQPLVLMQFLWAGLLVACRLLKDLLEAVVL